MKYIWNLQVLTGKKNTLITLHSLSPKHDHFVCTRVLYFIVIMAVGIRLYCIYKYIYIFFIIFGVNASVRATKLRLVANFVAICAGRNARTTSNSPRDLIRTQWIISEMATYAATFLLIISYCLDLLRLIRLLLSSYWHVVDIPGSFVIFIYYDFTYGRRKL